MELQVRAEVCCTTQRLVLNCSPAQAVMPSGQPDWASLPRELWTKVLQALSAQGDAVQRCRQLATLSAVCRTLRTAVLGPDAGSLWWTVSFASSHAGLEAWQSWQLNRLVASQARHASHAFIMGGGWDLDELQLAAASLQGHHARRRLYLHTIDTPAEAECLSAVLPGCLAGALTFVGSQALVLPSSLQAVDMHVGAPADMELALVTAFVAEQARKALQQLRNLTRLTSLHFASPLWCLQEGDVACLAACLPHLKVLVLTLYVTSALGQHALQALSGLSASVRLSLTVVSTSASAGGSVAPFLQALCRVRLFALTLQCKALTGTPYALTPADEAHLAQCRISRQLTLRMQSSEPAERLRRLLPRVNVVYEQAV